MRITIDVPDFDVALRMEWDPLYEISAAPRNWSHTLSSPTMKLMRAPSGCTQFRMRRAACTTVLICQVKS